MRYTDEDGVGIAIRHLSQKLQHEKEHFGRGFNPKRLRRHQVDELSLLHQSADSELNETLGKHLECELKVSESGYPFGSEHLIFCNGTFDSVLCWPTTPAGTTAYLPCFKEFNGVKYDESGNSSRECFGNGTWSTYSNYSACQPVEAIPIDNLDNSQLTSVLYLIGYSISLVALLIAMSIFLYFKDLRCLRNTIHTNLMFTYVMADFTWILTSVLQSSVEENETTCVILILVLHYFHITTFFWMFVEGLYLYMLVVETFNRQNIRAFVCVSIGWGIPIVVIVVWGIAKATTTNHVEQEQTVIDGLLPSCHWMNASLYDWIFKVPILTVMALNSVFLVMIMWVLITKLRSANNAETQQYRKATKALMVLIPLLGITYILSIVASTDGVVAQVFYNLRAFMLSSQGFLVALFYCFLNSEVQNTVRHHMESWQTARTIRGDRRYNYSRDWSPRSRTESIRLYSQPTITPYRKRESCCSEVTTTTVVNSSTHNNNGNRVSNGSMNAGVTYKVTTPFLTVTTENDV